MIKANWVDICENFTKKYTKKLAGRFAHVANKFYLAVLPFPGSAPKQVEGSFLILLFMCA